MIIGIGIDHVAINRVEELLRRHPDRAAARLFTPAERARCATRRDAAACYAARFAAKEALLKALGTGLTDGIRWHEIEVTAGGNGEPCLVVSGRAAECLREKGGTATHLSFSHDEGLAVAVVVIEA